MSWPLIAAQLLGATQGQRSAASQGVQLGGTGGFGQGGMTLGGGGMGGFMNLLKSKTAGTDAANQAAGATSSGMPGYKVSGVGSLPTLGS